LGRGLYDTPLTDATPRIALFRRRRLYSVCTKETKIFETTRQVGVCVVDMEHPSAPRSLTPPRTGSMLG